jgi:hypothetical protein
MESMKCPMPMASRQTYRGGRQRARLLGNTRDDAEHSDIAGGGGDE